MPAALGYQVAGVQVKMHLKVDTGMSRIGFVYQTPGDGSSLREMEEACRLPGLIPEGVFTHFAVSDDGNPLEAFTLRQFTCLKKLLIPFRAGGFILPFVTVPTAAPLWG